MNNLREEVYHDTNDKYLASPHLEELRKISKVAFDEFMKNEEDNKEFTDFINEELREREQNYIKTAQ